LFEYCPAFLDTTGKKTFRDAHAASKPLIGREDSSALEAATKEGGYQRFKEKYAVRNTGRINHPA
jgi:hypothetical protein